MATAKGVAARLRRAAQALGGAAPFDPIRARSDTDDAALTAIITARVTDQRPLLDIGAFRGRFLGPALAAAPGGAHIAYEPQPALAEALRRKFPAVDVRQAAVSDETGEATFQIALDQPPYSGLRQREDIPGGSRFQQIAVRVDQLDEALPVDWVPAVMKVDVEGNEMAVVAGARKLLERHETVVAFEFGDGHLYGSTPRGMADLFESIGLRIFDLGGRHLPGAAFEEACGKDGWNWLARP